MTSRRGVSQARRAGSPAGAPQPERRLRWWREIALVLPAYWLYSLVRNAVPEQESAAVRQANQLYGLERALGIDIELGVNQAIDRITWLIVGMNYYYAVAHFVVTAGVLVWLYRRRPGWYRAARTVFLITNALALVAFYSYPLAPPRLLPEHGYVDTVISHGTWGSWASGDVAAASNQYAAMPSMHVAWSLWCALVLVLLSRRQWVRLLGVAHAATTLVVIVATANHFVLDAVGGALALGAGYGTVRLASAARLSRWLPQPRLPQLARQRLLELPRVRPLARLPLARRPLARLPSGRFAAAEPAVARTPAMADTGPDGYPPLAIGGDQPSEPGHRVTTPTV